MPGLILFAPDVVGTADQILEQLSADPVVGAVSELRLELPYQFHREDYEQILHDFRHLVAPELGWRAGGRVDSPNSRHDRPHAVPDASTVSA